MTTYDVSAVSDAVIAHKKGITLQQGRALRDNPIAIGEGAETAPKISGAAFGSGFWLGIVRGTPAAYTQDLSNVRWLRIEASTGVTQIALSSNGGATYGSAQNLITNTKYIDLQTGGTLLVDGTETAGDFTPLSGCNAIRLTVTVPGGGGTAYVDLYAIQGRTSW